MFEFVRKLHVLLTRRERIQAVVLLGAMLTGAVREMVGVGAIPAFVSTLTDPEAFRAHPAGRWFVQALELDSPEAW